MYFAKVIGRAQWDNSGTSGLYTGPRTAAACQFIIICYYLNSLTQSLTHSKHSNISGYYHNFIVIQVV